MKIVIIVYNYLYYYKNFYSKFYDIVKILARIFLYMYDIFMIFFFKRFKGVMKIVIIVYSYLDYYKNFYSNFMI
jgi:hypothetical protein